MTVFFHLFSNTAPKIPLKDVSWKDVSWKVTQKVTFSYGDFMLVEFYWHWFICVASYRS